MKTALMDKTFAKFWMLLPDFVVEMIIVVGVSV
jgi:hypothetical protein